MVSREELLQEQQARKDAESKILELEVRCFEEEEEMRTTRRRSRGGRRGKEEEARQRRRS